MFKKHIIHTYDYWLKKNAYYHNFLARLYIFSVPSGLRVLQVGCKTGFLLNSIKPSFGMGIDTDSGCIQVARNTFPNYVFREGGIEQIPKGTLFDYIILSSVTMEVDDIQLLLIQLRDFSHPGTRYIIDSYSYLWEPLLWLIQKLGLRRQTELKNWISYYDLCSLLDLADCQVITHDRYMLMPFYIPLISWFFNKIISCLPLINRTCLIQWVVARPLFTDKKSHYTVSVIIPCRNERGNIEQAVVRTPVMGSGIELIFVEGGSKDGTLNEIERVQKKYSNKQIRFIVQNGRGKGNAVREGFSAASGDVLIILDGDLTVPPEEMPKFYEALVARKGELINGSRLVYGMEDEAMRFLNLLANYCFGIGFSWVLGQRIKDTLCGTKVLFKKDYEKIAQGRDFFGDFDPFGDFDLIFGAAKQNLKIIDIPVHYKNRTYGETQIRRFYHGILLLRMSFLAFRKFKFRS
jgi:hypothetical protein